MNPAEAILFRCFVVNEFAHLGHNPAFGPCTALAPEPDSFPDNSEPLRQVETSLHFAFAKRAWSVLVVHGSFGFFSSENKSGNMPTCSLARFAVLNRKPFHVAKVSNRGSCCLEKHQYPLVNGID